MEPREQSTRSTLRLFIAIPIPEDVRARLAAAQETLRAAGAPFRWTRPEGMHLTLVFLGSTDVSLVPDVERSVAGAAARSRPLALGAYGLGCFPSWTRPRVLWAGLTGDLDVLVALQRDVACEVKRLGLELEKRPFHPHVTLGRAATDRQQGSLPIEPRSAGTEQQFGRWQATEIELIRSTLARAGSIYTTLYRASLGASSTQPVAESGAS